MNQKSDFIKEFSETINYFSEFHNIFDTLDLVESLKGGSIIKLSEVYTSHQDSQVQILAKAILMRNLILDDEENFQFKLKIEDQIKGLLSNNISNLNFGSTFLNKEEEDENLKIIKDIERGLIQENYIYEFKETLFLPVLNNEDREKVQKLESLVNEK